MDRPHVQVRRREGEGEVAGGGDRPGYPMCSSVDRAAPQTWLASRWVGATASMTRPSSWAGGPTYGSRCPITAFFPYIRTDSVYADESTPRFAATSARTAATTASICPMSTGSRIPAMAMVR